MKKLAFLIFCLTLLKPFPALSAPVNYGDFQGAQYVRNHDGDTNTFSLPWVHRLIGEKISIRVNGIDTPEIGEKCEQEKEIAYGPAPVSCITY